LPNIHTLIASSPSPCATDLCIDPGRLQMKCFRFRGEGASAIRAGSAAIPNLDRTIQTSSGMHAWREASPLLDVTSTGTAGPSAFYFLRAYTAAALRGINGHPCVHICSSSLPPLSQSIDDSRHQLQLQIFGISCSPLPRRYTSLS